MRVGFVALTDAAPLVIAHEQGLYRRRGLDVRLERQVSWPAVRDGLLTGYLDAAHSLFSLPLSVAFRVTGRPDQLLPIAMVLSSNGQAITVRADADAAPYATAAGSLTAIARESATRRLTFAMTYPGGTHDIWLRYWLAAAGIGGQEVDVLPIPPSQMVANLRAGTMDGFSAGEPWNALAVREGIGFTAIDSHEIAPGHPEKALVVSPQAARERAGEIRELVAATLDACRWLDHAPNRLEAAEVLSDPRYLNLPAELIAGRLVGRMDPGGGLPQRSLGAGAVRFHDGGEVNLPRRGHARWFAAQFERFGLLPGPVDVAGTLEKLLLRDLYADAARSVDVALPDDDLTAVHSPLDGLRSDPSLRGVA